MVDPSSTVTVHLNDSRSSNTTAGQGLQTHSSGNYYYTAVDLPDSARVHGRFTVESGEEKRSSIEEFPRGYAVVVVLYRGDKIGWWASANCNDRALVGLDVLTRPSQYGDAEAGYVCQ